MGPAGLATELGCTQASVSVSDRPLPLLFLDSETPAVIWSGRFLVYQSPSGTDYIT